MFVFVIVKLRSAPPVLLPSIMTFEVQLSLINAAEETDPVNIVVVEAAGLIVKV